MRPFEVAWPGQRDTAEVAPEVFDEAIRRDSGFQVWTRRRRASDGQWHATLEERLMAGQGFQVELEADQFRVRPLTW